MKSIADSIRLMYTEAGTPEVVLSLRMPPKKAQEGAQKLKEVTGKGKTLDVTIEQHRKKRSLDSNAYLWILCQKIAEVLHTTKEAVYREFIRRVGQFEILPIREDAVDKWIKIWQSHGLGWVSEVLDDSKIDGYKRVISYYGSSVYDSRSMSILLDEVVQECKTLGIETMTPEELQSLKESWGKPLLGGKPL